MTRTNRSGKLDLQRIAAEGEPLECVLRGLGVLHALEVHKRVAARGVRGYAVERAVLREQVHQIGVGYVRRQVTDPEVVGR